MNMRGQCGGLLQVVARLSVVVFLMALAACEASRPTALPKEFLGQWYCMGSSGGLTGDGGGDEATGYIVIMPDNTMELHEEDGTVVGSVKFTVSRGKTIYSTDDCWIVSSELDTPEVIVVSADGLTMSLKQNAYDGIGRNYARSR